jgi:hypothetical protein
MSSVTLLSAHVIAFHLKPVAFFAIHPLFSLPYIAPFCFQYINWRTELSSNLAKANDSIATINNKLISIVERGVKNGYNYIKYSNGDAVVWCKYTWNTNIDISWYGLYFVSSKAVDFPFTFKEAPLIIVSPGTTNELYWIGVNEVSTTGYKLTAYSVKKGMCYSQCNMLIIGKWK